MTMKPSVWRYSTLGDLSLRELFALPLTNYFLIGATHQNLWNSTNRTDSTKRFQIGHYFDIQEDFAAETPCPRFKV